MALTFASALSAASMIHFLWQAALILGLMFAGAITFGLRYLLDPVTRKAKTIETYAGLWSLSLYLSLGIIPLLVRTAGQTQ
jgi:4-hydroxybenzoate polyprenyltransferase